MKLLDLHEFFQPGDLVFDVGACIGTQTREYLNLDAGCVVAFEPNPEMQKILHEKFSGGDLRVKIEHRGLWECACVLKFHVSTNNPATSTFLDNVPLYYRQFHPPNYNQWDKDIEVPVFTLDEAFDLYGVPQFMKIDVESAEEYVLRGMHKVVPFLSFEFYPRPLSTFRAPLELLTALGYRQFNYTISQAFDYKCIFSETLVFDDWVDYDTILARLETEPIVPPSPFGDIYAKA